MCGFACKLQLPAEARKGHQIPGAGVTSICERPDVGAGTKLRSSLRVECALNF